VVTSSSLSHNLDNLLLAELLKPVAAANGENDGSVSSRIRWGQIEITRAKTTKAAIESRRGGFIDPDPFLDEYDSELREEEASSKTASQAAFQARAAIAAEANKKRLLKDAEELAMRADLIDMPRFASDLREIISKAYAREARANKEGTDNAAGASSGSEVPLDASREGSGSEGENAPAGGAGRE
jgi:hypothetical protein